MGVLGETMVPTLDESGHPIMQGMGAIRGSEKDCKCCKTESFVSASPDPCSTQRMNCFISSSCHGACHIQHFRLCADVDRLCSCCFFVVFGASFVRVTPVTKQQVSFSCIRSDILASTR